MSKQRRRIPKHQKIRAELQKEIGSRCPFCINEEVGHFEIHHIDENNSNNVFENLLLLCSTCHSKFTKKEWPISKARQQKDEYIKLPFFRLLESNPVSFPIFSAI